MTFNRNINFFIERKTVHTQDENFLKIKNPTEDSLISCLCCIPRAWTIIANERWLRIFENKSEGLYLKKEFRRDRINSFIEPICFFERVSQELDESLWQDKYDVIVLVSAYNTLDILDKYMSASVSGRVIARIIWPAKTESIIETSGEEKIFEGNCDSNQS